jgi:hypothetical protein
LKLEYSVFCAILSSTATVFCRDPETKKWLYVDAAKVTKIIVNESEGKIPEQYVIRDINFNFKEMVAVTPHGTTNTAPSGTSSYTSGGGMDEASVGDAAQPPGTRFHNQTNEITNRCQKCNSHSVIRRLRQ